MLSKIISKIHSFCVVAGALAVRGAFFGSALGDILFSNVGCQGNESRLVDCTNGVHFCDHTEDAGVICPPSM